MNDLHFLQDVLRRPLQMGAILPSSPQLARRMVELACIEPGQLIVELGAGSGAFTREIVARHPDNPLLLLEPGHELAAGLRRKFPQAVVSTALAQDLGRVLTEHNLGPVDRVISGLPWSLWKRPVQEQVLGAITPLMSKDGRLVTFHYVHARELGLIRTTRSLLRGSFALVHDSPIVWANVPPAYVHIADGPLP